MGFTYISAYIAARDKRMEIRKVKFSPGQRHKHAKFYSNLFNFLNEAY